jgi:hypothetical protein
MPPVALDTDPHVVHLRVPRGPRRRLCPVRGVRASATSGESGVALFSRNGHRAEPVRVRVTSAAGGRGPGQLRRGARAKRLLGTGPASAMYSRMPPSHPPSRSPASAAATVSTNRRSSSSVSGVLLPSPSSGSGAAEASSPAMSSTGRSSAGPWPTVPPSRRCRCGSQCGTVSARVARSRRRSRVAGRSSASPARTGPVRGRAGARQPQRPGRSRSGRRR